ncbi:MAG: hypothetical protein IKW21_05220 [Lachnospiraceae bacterium]|nr:hypothetical protein [Lachnospiraceae bacterium]
MRTILFKAKRLDNGEWVAGGSIIVFEDNGVKSLFMPQYNEKCDCEHDEITDDILSFSNCRFYKVDPDTICRFTGELDKNGNMIWENDICNYCEDEIEHTDNCIIRFGDHSFNGDKNIGFFTEWLKFNDIFREDIGFWVEEREIEVIGNIFDNPELLKGGNNE